MASGSDGSSTVDPAGSADSGRSFAGPVVGPGVVEVSDGSLPPAELAAEAPCDDAEFDEAVDEVVVDEAEFDEAVVDDAVVDDAVCDDGPSAEGDDALGPGPSDADGSAALMPGPATSASPMPAAATTPLMPYVRLSIGQAPPF
ncbi:hypothetical protein [Mycolicibacterium hodleri]|uniref:hypothetical protein n=1 Tax=Mycolicibacterium hodleri TaxID=49897 RepID=UPI0021F26477|nr:hypothetical protein [Mycolicibacterium hodleri]